MHKPKGTLVAMADLTGDFYEDDEPLADVQAAFALGEPLVTGCDVPWVTGIQRSLITATASPTAGRSQPVDNSLFQIGGTRVPAIA